MLGRLFDRGKCLVGFHEGEWSYRNPGDCAQAQTCSRCDTVSQRTEHLWPQWAFRAEDACDLVRVCDRCSDTESRVEHAWQEPVYQSSGSCHQVQVCARCRDELESDIRHQWSDWEYAEEDSCVQVETCGRCGQRGSRRQVAHRFGEARHSPFYEARVISCRRCAEMYVSGDSEADQPLVSLQELDAAVTRVMQAGDWEAVRRTLHQDRQALFSGSTDAFFRFALDQYPQDDDTQGYLTQVQTLLHRCRQDGIDATIQEIIGPVAEPQPAYRGTGQAGTASSRGSQASSTPSPGVDRRLEGHWRFTESSVNEYFSIATDTHLVLDGQGRFARYSNTAGSTGTSSQPPEYGDWWTEGDRLYLRYDGGYSSSHDFEVHPDTLFLPNDSQNLWHRV